MVSSRLCLVSSEPADETASRGRERSAHGFCARTVARGSLLEGFADGAVAMPNGAVVSRRNPAPPRPQRLALAAQLDAHAVGEPDPVGEAMAGHRDHDRNIRAQRALDQIGKALSLALLPSEWGQITSWMKAARQDPPVKIFFVA